MKSSISLAGKVRIGTYFPHAPYGIAFVVDGSTGFLITPECDGAGGPTPYHEKDSALAAPAETAADYSFVRATMRQGEATIQFTWGQTEPTGQIAVVGMFVSDKPVDLCLSLPKSWPKFQTIYFPQPDGVSGYGIMPTGDYVPFGLKCLPVPIAVRAGGAQEAKVTLSLAPGEPSCFVAGIGALMQLDTVVRYLAGAERGHAARHMRAEGAWGDFAGALAHTMNASRVYSSDNKMVAHVVGRGSWIYHQPAVNGNPDLGPYFCRDSFFSGLLGCLSDPKGARETIRAVLSLQTPEGFVGCFSHWMHGNRYVATDRSGPPVGAMCVWKMHQRWPDKHFLDEVYPRLVRWHEWWPLHRDGNYNGLLEWGSASGTMQAAMYETGSPDTVQFEGAEMQDATMNADAIDLNALWAADAEYLALIAGALDKKTDVQRFQTEHQEMNQRINSVLWNEQIGMYCSRLWDKGGFLTRLTPMNFYPLICGAPDAARAERMLEHLYRPDKFWGQWLLPTVAFDDPARNEQHGWRGNVWPPANYLVWQGLLRYAGSARCAEYVRRNIQLFMKGWNARMESAESYRSDTGDCCGHPHYTVGALLPLMGIEALMDADAHLQPVPRENIAPAESVTVHHVPCGGVLHRIVADKGKVVVTRE